MDDGMGTSMVIVHTEKGRAMWEDIKEETSWFACEEEDVLQPRLVSPTLMPKGRKGFMAFYRMLPFPVFAVLFSAVLFARDVRRRIKGC